MLPDIGMTNSTTRDTAPCDAFEHLACPVDGAPLVRDGNWLKTSAGRRYPIVAGVAVMLREDVTPTIGLAAQSLFFAQRWAEGQRDDPYFIETLGVSPKQREEIRTAMASEPSTDVDPTISYLVAATNGILYTRMIGKLDLAPIPELRLPASDSTQLLDIGCSWGRWSIAAAAKGYQPIGIDPSLGAVLAAKRLAKQNGVAFRGVVGDVRYLPFKAATIDAAFSYSVLQHFSKSDTEMAIRQISRVVTPGGLIRIQMASCTGIRSLQHLAYRGFREPKDFEVRYWSPLRLQRVFRDVFGNGRLEVDCYFGLGLQSTDRELYGSKGRILLSASEILRKISCILPPLRYVADSVYFVATNKSTVTQQELSQ